MSIAGHAPHRSKCGPLISEMGQKLRFRAAQRPCVIVRSTPVSRPSKGGPAWLFRANRPEQVQQKHIKPNSAELRTHLRYGWALMPNFSITGRQRSISEVTVARNSSAVRWFGVTPWTLSLSRVSASVTA